MKKGFSIIELIVAIGAVSLITTVMVTMVLKNNLLFINNSKENRQYFYSMEAIMFIQNEIQQAKSASITNNTIELKYPDITKKKNIKLNNSKIVIVDYKNNTFNASNNIITNISNFELVEKGNLVYITISKEDGEEFEKCIALKKAV